MGALFVALSLGLLLAADPAAGQLGPRDGAGLNPADLERVKVGEPAPDFTLEGMDRKRVTLSDFRGKTNVVLVFYRGHW